VVAAERFGPISAGVDKRYEKVILSLAAGICRGLRLLHLFDNTDVFQSNRKKIGIKTMPLTLVSSGPREHSADASGAQSRAAEFERESDSDDGYRHRMRMNLLAVAAVAMLMGAGMWIADAMVGIQKAHGCYASGQRFCSLI
jgi:hypothetical protein